MRREEFAGRDRGEIRLPLIRSNLAQFRRTGIHRKFCATAIVGSKHSVDDHRAIVREVVIHLRAANRVRAIRCLHCAFEIDASNLIGVETARVLSQRRECSRREKHDAAFSAQLQRLSATRCTCCVFDFHVAGEHDAVTRFIDRECIRGESNRAIGLENRHIDARRAHFDAARKIGLRRGECFKWRSTHAQWRWRNAYFDVEIRLARKRLRACSKLSEIRSESCFARASEYACGRCAFIAYHERDARFTEIRRGDKKIFATRTRTSAARRFLRTLKPRGNLRHQTIRCRKTIDPHQRALRTNGVRAELESNFAVE